MSLAYSLASGIAFPLASSLTGGVVITVSRYWVGGTGNSNDTAHWSLTSGGTGGASVPTGTVNAIWDGNSGGGTVTFNASFACRNFDSTNYTGTLAGSSAINASGSFILGSGITRTLTSAITLSSVATDSVVTTNGKTLASNITYNGAGGVWLHTDDFTTTGGITVTNGSPNITGRTVTCGTWAVGVAGTPILTGSTIITASGTFGGSGRAYNIVNNLLNSSANSTINGSNSFVNLAVSNSAGYTGQNYESGMTQTVSGAYSATAANASTARLFLKGATVGVTSALVLNGTASLSNDDCQDLVVTGSAAPISGTLLGDCGRCTGITFATPLTVYWVHPSTASQSPPTDLNFYTTSGGSTPSRAPLPQDTIRFDANSFSATGKTVVWGTSFRYAGIDCTGVTNSPTFSFVNTCTFYGSITFAAGLTLSGNNTITMGGDRAMTFTSAGLTITFGLSVQCANGSVTLQDNYTASQSINHSAGLFDLNNKNVTMTAGSITVSGAIAKELRLGSGTIEMQSTGTLISISLTGLTLVPSTSTIKFTNNGSASKTFAGGGATFNNVWVATAGTGVFIITGSNTFNDLKADAGRTLNITAGTTQTLSSLTLGNGVTLQSTTSSPYNIVNTSGNPIATTGGIISNCHYTGAAWVNTGGTDGGGNTGITFI